MKRSIKSPCLAALLILNAFALSPASAKLKTAALEAPINGKLDEADAGNSRQDYPSDTAMNAPVGSDTDSLSNAEENSLPDTESDAETDTQLKAQLNAPLNTAINSALTAPGAHGNTADTITTNTAPQAQLPWLLPMNGQVDKTCPATTSAIGSAINGQATKQYAGSITMSDSPTLVSYRIDQLLDCALEHDAKAQSINTAVKHFNTATQKLVAQSKDAGDYLIPYRGFGPSSEAGDIILDEKLKLKSKAAAEFARQQQIDDKHVKIVTCMSQIAMGLGIKDEARSKQVVASGKASLALMVGGDEADKTASELALWANSLNVPDAVYKQDVWDVSSREDKLQTVIASALNSDPVVKEVKLRLHKYNHKGKFVAASAHIVESTLGVASMTPTFVGPAAKTALLAFVMATGGPESSKLMKELYLDKRLESRAKVVDEEAHLALDNYHVAMLTQNKALLAFSESLVGQMAGADQVTKILGTSVLTWAPCATASAEGDNNGKSSLVQSNNIGL